MTYQECVDIFKKHNFSENQIINLTVQILGQPSGSMIELKGVPMKAFLDTSLNIVYQGGKRYSKLEEAIKEFAKM